MSRRRTCAVSCSINTLRYLLCALHSTSMWLPQQRQRGHDIRPRAERCYPKTIRRIVFGWKSGESGEKHRTRLCRRDCVCPSRVCRLFRHAQENQPLSSGWFLIVHERFTCRLILLLRFCLCYDIIIQKIYFLQLDVLLCE